MTLDEMAQESASVIIAVADSIDTEAGNIGVGPQTMVNMKVEQLIWGYEVDTELTFFLPEGSWTWNEERPLFTDSPGIPKIVPGKPIFYFFMLEVGTTRLSQGLIKGFTGSERLKEKLIPFLKREDALLALTIILLNGAQRSLNIQLIGGHYFNGTRYYYGAESVLNLDPDPDDEGAGTYPSDEHYVLDPGLISDRLDSCLRVDQAIDSINSILQNYSPTLPFSPISALGGPGYRDPVPYSSNPKPAVDNVCFADTNIPYSCEVLP